MDTSIYEFHTSLCIPLIKKTAFNLPHITILGTFNCGNTRREAFKNSGYFQYVLCPNDYEERVLASFSHQIQSVYYCGNISVSTEGTALEKFGFSKHPLLFYSPKTCTSHTVFCSFFPDDINKDAATTIKHIKIIIELLKNGHIIFLILVQYGRININLLITTDLPLNHFYFKYYHRPIL